MRTKSLLLLAILALALSLLSGVAHAQDFQVCGENSTCPNGFYCEPYNNVCVLECSDDDDCSNYYSDFADETICHDDRCTLRECYYDWECEYTFQCNDGRCGTDWKSCRDDWCQQVYGPTSSCNESDHQCVQKTCKTDSECSGGLKCDEGICSNNRCRYNSDCYAKYGTNATCRQGICFEQVCESNPLGTRPNCDEGFVCEDHKCGELSCSNDHECIAAYSPNATCDTKTKKCVPETCDPALEDDTCPFGYVCDSYESACKRLRECESDYACSDYGDESSCSLIDGVCMNKEACVASDPIKSKCMRRIDGENLTCIGKSCLDIWSHFSHQTRPGEPCNYHEDCWAIDPYATCVFSEEKDFGDEDYRGRCVLQACTVATDTTADSCQENFVCNASLKFCLPKGCDGPEDCSAPYTCNPHTTACEIQCTIGLTEDFCESVYGPGAYCQDECRWSRFDYCINDNRCNEYHYYTGFQSTCDKKTGECTEGPCEDEVCIKHYGTGSKCHSNKTSCEAAHTCDLRPGDDFKECPQGMICKSYDCIIPECLYDSDCQEQYGVNAYCDTYTNYLCIAQSCGYSGLAECPAGAECVENTCIVRRCKQDSDCFEEHGAYAKCDLSDPLNHVCVPHKCSKNEECPGGFECEVVDGKGTCVAAKECRQNSDCFPEYGQKSTCNTDTNTCVPISCTPATVSDDCPVSFICNSNNQCEKTTMVLQRVVGTFARQQTGDDDTEHKNAQQRFNTNMKTSVTCKPLHNNVSYGKQTLAYYVGGACDETEVKRIASVVNDGITPASLSSQQLHGVQQQPSGPVHVTFTLEAVSTTVPKECFSDADKIECDTATCAFDCPSKDNSATTQSLMIAFVLVIIVAILC